MARDHNRHGPARYVLVLASRRKRPLYRRSQSVSFRRHSHEKNRRLGREVENDGVRTVGVRAETESRGTSKSSHADSEFAGRQHGRPGHKGTKVENRRCQRRQQRKLKISWSVDDQQKRLVSIVPQGYKGRVTKQLITILIL